MIKEIIYGKRQSGKTTYVINRMLKQQNTIYVVYKIAQKERLIKDNFLLKYRIISIGQFNNRIKDKTYYDYVDSFYFEWLDWIKLKEDAKNFLKNKNEIVIFDQFTLYETGNADGIKLTHIEKQMMNNNFKKISDSEQKDISVFDVQYQALSENFFGVNELRYIRFKINQIKLIRVCGNGTIEAAIKKQDDEYYLVTINQNNFVYFREKISKQEYQLIYNIREKNSYTVWGQKTLKGYLYDQKLINIKDDFNDYLNHVGQNSYIFINPDFEALVNSQCIYQVDFDPYFIEETVKFVYKDKKLCGLIFKRNNIFMYATCSKILFKTDDNIFRKYIFTLQDNIPVAINHMINNLYNTQKYKHIKDINFQLKHNLPTQNIQNNSFKITFRNGFNS